MNEFGVDVNRFARERKLVQQNATSLRCFLICKCVWNPVQLQFPLLNNIFQTLFALCSYRQYPFWIQFWGLSIYSFNYCSVCFLLAILRITITTKLIVPLFCIIEVGLNKPHIWAFRHTRKVVWPVPVSYSLYWN